MFKALQKQTGEEILLLEPKWLKEIQSRLAGTPLSQPDQIRSQIQLVRLQNPANPSPARPSA